MAKNVDIEKTYNHWLNTSEKDSITMIHLYNKRIIIGRYLLDILLLNDC